MSDLSALVPWSLYDLLEPALSGKASPKRVEGSVLFCDVAGFTPLTEALQTIGKEGAEELTRILNRYFSRMIGILQGYGGDVLRFGGDSMTVLFPQDGGDRAARGALTMMDAMSEFARLETRAGPFGLSVKIGASTGSVLLGVLGTEATGYDYYALGTPLDQAAEAEHASRPGWVVVHSSFLGGLGGAESEPVKGPFSRLLGLPAPVSGASHEASLHPPPRPEVLGRFAPSYLQDRAGKDALGEHRGTAVIFASFAMKGTGTAEEDDDLHERLGRIYGHLATTAKRYGGILNKMDMGDKGNTAILLFGSPYAIEDKEEMALRAAMDLLSSKELPADSVLRMGVTSSPLFVGPVGSQGRREFTVMGDGINLAARLMQAAKAGQALCASHCVAEASTAFTFQSLPAIFVKGKKEAVPVFEPIGEKKDEALGGGGLALVGRQSVCDLLKAYAFGEAGGAETSKLSGPPKPLCLIAEAGMGKTALMEWLAAQAVKMKMAVTKVPLGTSSQERAYSAWRGPLRAVAGLKKGDGPTETEAARDRALRAEPAGLRPLVNGALGLGEGALGGAIKNLTPKERKDLAIALMGKFLASGGPRLILLDNLQWADPLSLEFLTYLLEDNPAPAARLIVTLRPGISEASDLVAAMAPIELEGFSQEELALFLKTRHGLIDMEPPVAAWFHRRSKGNPALAGALVAALDSEGLLLKDEAGRRVDPDRLSSTRFPDSLEGLYMARVDHLPARPREVLQSASILGGSVSLNLLRKVTGFDETALSEALGILVAAGLLVPDTWGQRPYFRFPDALLKDAVYGSLPYALKRAGHLRVAQFLEPEWEGNPKLWPALAHHFQEGDDPGRAKVYHRLAGRDALAHFDNLTALKHLEAVCSAFTPCLDDVEDAFCLLDVYGALSRWEGAKGLLPQIESSSEGLSLGHRSRLQSYLAQDLAAQNKWEEAEGALKEGLALAREAGDALLEAKSQVNLVGRVYGPTGQLAKAQACLEEALALPPGPGRQSVRTMAGMNLGMVLWHLGHLEAARQAFDKAFREAVRYHLGPSRGVIANNLCALLYEMGAFQESVTWGKRAVATLETFSARVYLQNAQYNLSMAHLAMGYAQRVVDLLEPVCRQASLYGNLLAEGRALQGLSQAWVFLGDLDRALGCSGGSLEAFRRLRNGRDFRARLVDMANLCHSLRARLEFLKLWKETGAQEFLDQTQGDPSQEASLQRIRGWMERGTTKDLEEGERFVEEAGEASAEERLTRLLWVAEAALDGHRPSDAASLLPRLSSALTACPNFECRVRLLRIGLCLQDTLSSELKREQKREARTLLTRCMGGPWGLRLLALLCGRNQGSKRPGALRALLDERLAFARSHSPPWAWKRIAASPEVKAAVEDRA